MNKGVIYAGDLQIYSAPAALISHVEWAINQHLGVVQSFRWLKQPVSPGSYGLEMQWRSRDSMAPKLALSLKSWKLIRFELREIDQRNSEGVLFRCTPDLGLHQVSINPIGEVVINENQIKSLIADSIGVKKLVNTLENAIGVEWDRELEPFRIALAEGNQHSLSQIG